MRDDHYPSSYVNYSSFFALSELWLRRPDEKWVALEYVHLLQTHPRRAEMDRKGKQLTSCGDIDLASTACDIGLGTGQFTDLKLTHLIPKNRLEEEYLLRLAEANGYSSLILESFRGKFPAQPNHSWRTKLLQQYQIWKMEPREKRFHTAFAKGRALAIQEIFASLPST